LSHTSSNVAADVGSNTASKAAKSSNRAACSGTFQYCQATVASAKLYFLWQGCHCSNIDLKSNYKQNINHKHHGRTPQSIEKNGGSKLSDPKNFSNGSHQFCCTTKSPVASSKRAKALLQATGHWNSLDSSLKTHPLHSIAGEKPSNGIYLGYIASRNNSFLPYLPLLLSTPPAILPASLAGRHRPWRSTNIESSRASRRSMIFADSVVRNDVFLLFSMDGRCKGNPS
jgi:hypothetical protein